MTTEVNHNNKRRNIVLVSVLAFFLIIGIAWFLYWLFVSRYYPYTDNAYVSGNQVILTPQVPGFVTAIYGDNTSFVREGDLLIELNRSDYELKRQKSKEELATTVRNVAQLFEKVKEKEALCAVRTAKLKLAEFDLKQRKGLPEEGVISLQEFENNKIAYDVAKSDLTLAEAELREALALVENTTLETHPLILTAISSFEEAHLNLLRCQVLSPVTGYIAKRAVQVGDFVREGKTMLMVVPLEFLWLDANYKETQLKRIRVGQEVTITSDLYGDEITYHGKVVGFTAGTGAAFALLPPQNASGNWIKIVQRLPVRISIDCEELKKNPLFIGLSLRVSVNTHNLSGSMLSCVTSNCPSYTTCVYEREKKALQELKSEIQKIIHENTRT